MIQFNGEMTNLDSRKSVNLIPYIAFISALLLISGYLNTINNIIPSSLIVMR